MTASLLRFPTRLRGEVSPIVVRDGQSVKIRIPLTTSRAGNWPGARGGPNWRCSRPTLDRGDAGRSEFLGPFIAARRAFRSLLNALQKPSRVLHFLFGQSLSADGFHPWNLAKERSENVGEPVGEIRNV